MADTKPTFLGMTAVDAFPAHHYDARDEYKVTFGDFTLQLAYRLIFNKLPALRTLRSDSNLEGELSHCIKTLIYLPQYPNARAAGKRAQWAPYHCEIGSEFEVDVYYSICGVGAGSDCLIAHLATTST
ncbi:hypothetical protein PHMEG_00028802 [Phytophthora megakarya]|uniref:Uncharacterized protein n=1 Tax=Phytophthora megakarya TaxID=4795 RepID=A0A225V5P9_9STRA|nr:hypothetical protein PHMEG_00028802 [Phytophthora megakarya]